MIFEESVGAENTNTLINKEKHFQPVNHHENNS